MTVAPWKLSPVRWNLCVIYAAFALISLVATWSQNLLYFTGDSPAGFGQYILDLKVNGAARSFTVDIGLFLLAATFFMVIEARKLGIRFVWLYVLFGFAVAISVTFPLFLIARELRLAKIGPVDGELKPTVSDSIGLGIVTAIVFAMSFFILT
jgi:hypothetical protein